MRAGRWLPLVFAFGAACGHGDPCRNRLLARTPSPGRRLEAVVFERNCGAATASSTEVSILPSVDRSRPTVLWSTQEGNVFAADKGGGHRTGSQVGGPWVQVEWTRGSTTPETLLVRYDATARVWRRETKAFGSTVRYEAAATQ